MAQPSLLLIFTLFSLIPLPTKALPLSTDSRWTVDERGRRVKLACANWVAYLESMVAEGLSKLSSAGHASNDSQLSSQAVKVVVDCNFNSASNEAAAEENRQTLQAFIFAQLKTITFIIALNVSVSADSFTQNDYQPPTAAMSTAFTPTNVSAPLQLSWFPDEATAEYYVYMHFAEIAKFKNETRVFDLSINGNPFTTNFEPSYLSIFTLYTGSPVSGRKIEFLLEKTEQSTLPPIINAVEIYKAIEFSQIETFQEHDEV